MKISLDQYNIVYDKGTKAVARVYGENRGGYVYQGHFYYYDHGFHKYRLDEVKNLVVKNWR